MKAVSAEQMRILEQRAVQAGVSLDALMENAGLAVADFVTTRLDQKHSVYGSNVTVLVGPGNNGSDGLVAARHLSRRGVKVRVFALTKRPDPDEKRVLAEEAGTEFVSIAAGDAHARAILQTSVSNSDLVLDAVLGTGRARDIGEPLAGLLGAVKETGAEVVAVDLPTGLNADTGIFDKSGLPASTTLMLGYPKIGPLVAAGNGACGEITVLDIGIPDGLAADITSELLTDQQAAGLLPDRAADANKGSFGRTLILGGSTNYIGAPLLATRAAVRSGAGLVYLATGESVYRTIAGAVEEAIYLPLPGTADGEFIVRAANVELLSRLPQMSSVLIGPGLGQSASTVQLVEQLMRNLPKEVPVVIDADALNILSRAPGWSEAAQLAGASIILTPHPGEMARLLDMTIAKVQADRPGAALLAAERFNATVVLKGAATIIATPDGHLRVSPWVNPGLAKGGTGDVLAGLVAGLLAQVPAKPFDAASLAVYLHGLAADFARQQIGERGMTAGDVAALLPAAFQHLEKRSS
jgi:NAD(P)H-hydrate epimerase